MSIGVLISVIVKALTMVVLVFIWYINDRQIRREMENIDNQLKRLREKD